MEGAFQIYQNYAKLCLGGIHVDPDIAATAANSLKPRINKRNRGQRKKPRRAQECTRDQIRNKETGKRGFGKIKLGEIRKLASAINGLIAICKFYFVLVQEGIHQRRLGQ